jgi:hypothetical protein
MCIVNQAFGHFCALAAFQKGGISDADCKKQQQGNGNQHGKGNVRYFFQNGFHMGFFTEPVTSNAFVCR